MDCLTYEKNLKKLKALESVILVNSDSVDMLEKRGVSVGDIKWVFELARQSIEAQL